VDIRVECVTPEGLSGKKRVWFRGDFHLIGILGESPFVSKLRMAEVPNTASRTISGITLALPHYYPRSAAEWEGTCNAVDRWVHAVFSDFFRFDSESQPTHLYP
jgi:hypothetical protein